MMKKIVAISLTGLFLMSPSIVQATPLKIGVVNSNHIMSTSAKAQAVSEKLRKEFSGKEQEIITKDKALKALVEKMQRNAAIMSAPERTKLEKELNQKHKALQELQMKLQETASMRQRDEIQKMLEAIKNAITKIAVQDKLDMVLEEASAPYVANKIDITQKVMQKL